MNGAWKALMIGLSACRPGRALGWTIGLVFMLASGAAQEQDSTKPTFVMAAETEEVIDIPVGRSKVLRVPWMVSRVSVSDPDIADVEVLTPEQVLVVGMAVGSTDLILWREDVEGEEAWQARINVHIDLQQLKDDLKKLFPGSVLDVTQAGNVHAVTGVLEHADQVDQLHKLLAAMEFAYVDMTTVAGVQQVQLEVRMAEVNRTAVRQLGINAFKLDPPNAFGASLIGGRGGPINPVHIGVPGGKESLVAGMDVIENGLPFQFIEDVTVSPAVTLLAGFPSSDLEFFIAALKANQYLRILAEPTLVALSGGEASFLAGGEFPIPVVQSSAAGAGSITVEYKEFGVQLRFRPVVLGNGVIHLQIAPEVSDLTEVGAVEIEGFSIPGVFTRRAETTLELKSGQTFAMAGLLNNVTRSQNSRVPGLGELPVLGPLFRSTRYERNETELVVLVTASLVEPGYVSRDVPLPGLMHTPPNDWEFYFHGRLEGSAPAGNVSHGTSDLDELGLARLKGPGAWATHGGENTSGLMARPAGYPADDDISAATIGGEPSRF